MSQANSEDRDFRLEKSRDCLARVFTGLRVTRTIAQENTIRIHCKYLICRCLSWHHSHSTAVFRKNPQDAALDAVVVGNDMQTALRTRRLGCCFPQQAV